VPERQRADLVLVARGLFESRARAQAAITAGLVTADGRTVARASDLIARDAELTAEPAHPWVSRGGVKLTGALERYPVAVDGRVCLDVGASTGGFTEVLLARGARLVHAVDVGRDQLHPRLRGHPQLHAIEGTDIRDLAPEQLPERPDLVVIDASFISLKLVLPAALAITARPTDLLALIKPQFEAERRHSKKGIIRDAAVHAAVCDDIAAFVTSQGCDQVAVFPSPIAGGDGNLEFFVGARRG
jgi:23S rRNA (cytidine1920-2'-O)/16S rRNA (cytidine1409-2'-O)-methyltransferase